MTRYALLFWLVLAATIYSGAHAWRDFISGQTLWGFAGVVALVCLLIVLLTPLPTHAVKYDLIP